MNVERLNEITVTLYDETKNLSDEGRDYPILWNVMHMFSSSQLAKVLALRRGLDVEIAAITALLHDIAVIRTKKSAGHGQKAEQFVREVIEKHNNRMSDESFKVTGKEEETIIKAIASHSDKETYSDDPYAELMKDTDCVDRCLHGVKTEGVYWERCSNALKELGIDEF